jgi:S-adenosylmethionine-diacylgycerolhomoserine-N-methlytransferase
MSDTNQLLYQEQKMNNLYASQRHFYDFTRKYYLLGRDELLKNIVINPNDCVCEVGTGTARNLIKLAKANKFAQYYGLDISSEMLNTAKNSILKIGLENKIKLTQGAGEQLSYKENFGLSRPFDSIFFSYSMSIFTENSFEIAIKTAWENLKEGGVCYFVDFGDLSLWPKWFQKIFKSWLKLYQVEYREQAYEVIKSLNPNTFQLQPVLGRYALIASVKKTG